jgi:hypothetical protein
MLLAAIAKSYGGLDSDDFKIVTTLSRRCRSGQRDQAP